MAAVLLEAGSIVNRQEELELATPERRLTVAEAVTAAVEDFCASRGQAVAGRLPARNQVSVSGSAAAAVDIEGQVQASGSPLANSTVTLWQASARA